MPMNTLKVLVVDDEPTIADTLAVILRQSGFETHAAYFGEDAVRLAAKTEPDLMITDVMMPDKNGIAVANEVQRRGATMPGAVLLRTLCDCGAAPQSQAIGKTMGGAAQAGSSPRSPGQGRRCDG